MSSRPLNVSQFIENLNSLEDTFDSYTGSSSHPSPVDSNSGLNSTGNNGMRYPHQNNNSHQEEDLSIFSNTHFFDFDQGCSTDIAVTVDDLLMQQEKQLQSKFFNNSSNINNSNNASNISSPTDTSSDSQLELQLQLENLQQYSIANGLLNSTSSMFSEKQQQGQPAYQRQQLSSTQRHNLLSSITNCDQQQKTQSLIHTQTHFPSSVSGTGKSSGKSVNSKKRKASIAIDDTTSKMLESSVATSGLELPHDDEASRLVAEEDKRRRNTAASARFRIKKKLREQQMERTAKELQEKVQSLESKVKQLEMENKWLKDLVVEKNDARDVSSLQSMKNKILSGKIKLEKLS